MPTWLSGSVLERDRVGFDSPYLHLLSPGPTGERIETVPAAGSKPDGGGGFICITN